MTGESLGTIGQSQAEAKVDVESLPDWKRNLLFKPGISTRQGIAWGFSPAYEDTSTLVLTSRGSRFIDIRFTLDGDPTGGSAYWAFAGTSETSFPSASKTSAGGDGKAENNAVEIPCMAHCVWKHEIDNRNMGHSYSDEGDLYLLDNGECIEIGMMANPESGRLEMYKEYWMNIEFEKDSPCVVAKTEQRTGQEKGAGMVIKVGNHCQAIFQRQSASAEEAGRAGEVHVERWWRGREAEAGWVKDWRSSTGDDAEEDIVMPSKWVCGGERAIGDVIELLGRKWEVVECS